MYGVQERKILRHVRYSSPELCAWRAPHLRPLCIQIPPVGWSSRDVQWGIGSLRTAPVLHQIIVPSIGYPQYTPALGLG